VPTGLSELRSAAAVLAAVDPAALPTAALGEAVVELRGLIDGIEGTWLRLVAALDGSGALDGGTAAWLRCACRLSPAAARSRVTLSRRLAERPAVAAELTTGAISVDHARLVTTALDDLASVDTGLAAGTEAPLLDAARRLDPTRLRREIAHARHALVPEAAGAADELAHHRRRIEVASTFEGTVAISGVLDPEGGEVLLTALAALSSRCGPEDHRSAGQRRADALVELCRRQLDHGELPTLGGERPHLSVLIPISALTGAPPSSRPSADRTAAGFPEYHSDATPRRGSGHSSRPASPTGAGRSDRVAATDAARSNRIATTDAARSNRIATTDAARSNRIATTDAARSNRMAAAETVWGAILGPETARRLACDASVTRVLLSPESQPLDVGRRTRLIPPAIRTALVVRDRGCTYPGCDRGPQWTDAHHVRHWADGGGTSLDNLVLLCRHHHRAVHEGHAAVPHAPPRAA
jgi:hypothetical protein